MKEEMVENRDTKLKDISATDEAFFEKLSGCEYLKVLAVLQLHRSCWEVISEFPFLRINTDEVKKALADRTIFPLLTHNWIVQNLHEDDVRSKILCSMAGVGLNAGFAKNSQVIPRGLVNPQAFHFVDFNGSMSLVSRPFIALGTNLIIVEDDQIHHYRGIGNLDSTIKEGHTVVVSENYQCEELREMYDYLTGEYWHYVRDDKLTAEKQRELVEALNVVFQCNSEVEKDIIHYHKRMRTYSPAFNYAPVRTSRYGILNHREDSTPYVELNGSMLHFEKAQEELFHLSEAKTFEGKIRSSIYFVAALNATVESLSLFFWRRSFGNERPDKDYSSTEVLVKSLKGNGLNIYESSPEFALMEQVRKFRNHFFHIGVSELEVDLIPFS